jgi:hypothetical protein
MPMMRRLVFAMFVAACGREPSHATDASGGVDWSRTQVLAFGPYTLSPGEERSQDCVQITLHNDEDVFIHSVELTTSPGFHHSNWFWVPESTFGGDDATYHCADRHFDQAVAALYGGVVFAQSTQATHELQQFPPGAAILIPARSKLVGALHLFNPGDTPLQLSPTIALGPLPAPDVTTHLAGMALDNRALGLPPNMASRFTIDSCDLLGADQSPPKQWPPPNFRIYYALAHYHSLGTQLVIDALKPDGTSATVFTTTGRVGDTLGGPIDPPFEITGYTKLRFSCDYYNPTTTTVMWGNGGGEMCVFLAFTDAVDNYAGGVLTSQLPGPGTNVAGMMTFKHGCDTMFANPVN